MRHHPRRPLPDRAERTLRRWQSELDAEWRREQQLPADVARTAGTVADAHWTNRRSGAMRWVRRALGIMASPDLRRCMYCEHDRGRQIDHGEPKSRAPNRTYEWTNFVWACGTCNLDKRDLYEPEMIIPTVDDPLGYLDLTRAGRWAAIDECSRGEATLRALPYLNTPDLCTARTRRRREVLHMLAVLARQPMTTPEELDVLRANIVAEAFSDVFGALLRTLRLPGAEIVFSEFPQVVAFVALHPEMDSWVRDADEQCWLAAAGELSALATRIKLRADGTDEEA